MSLKDRKEENSTGPSEGEGNQAFVYGGVDVGASATKVVLINGQGRELARQKLTHLVTAARKIA